MRRRFLLPANLDQAARDAALDVLCRCYCRRRDLMVTGWLEGRYPGERGWVDQPGNTDAKQRVYFAEIHTRRKEQEEN
jgi:hypothetical protein